MIMRDISSPLYSLGVRGVEDACAQHGYGVIVGNTDAQMEREAALFQIYARKQLDGVIVISASGQVKDDHVCKWNSAFPVVLINRYSDSAEFNKILFDHYHGPAWQWNTCSKWEKGKSPTSPGRSPPRPEKLW